MSNQSLNVTVTAYSCTTELRTIYCNENEASVIAMTSYIRLLV